MHYLVLDGYVLQGGCVSGVAARVKLSVSNCDSSCFFCTLLMTFSLSILRLKRD